AGIIASGDNNFGFIGLHPRVLIAWLDWGKMKRTPSLLLSEFEQRKTGPMPIYLLAGDWDLVIPENAKINKPDTRFRDPIAGTIKKTQPLFVVAAGNAKNGNPD